VEEFDYGPPETPCGFVRIFWDFREGVVSPTNRDRPTRIE